MFTLTKNYTGLIIQKIVFIILQMPNMILKYKTEVCPWPGYPIVTIARLATSDAGIYRWVSEDIFPSSPFVFLSPKSITQEIHELF